MRYSKIILIFLIVFAAIGIAEYPALAHSPPNANPILEKVKHSAGLRPRHQPIIYLRSAEPRTQSLRHDNGNRGLTPTALGAWVKQAEKLLENQEVKYHEIKRGEKVVALEREVAVIGLHLASGELKKFIFTEFKNLDKTSGRALEPPLVIAQNEECDLLWLKGNRFGLRIELKLVCGGRSFSVIRIKKTLRLSPRVIIRKDAGSKGTCAKEITPTLVTYTPYSPDFHTPELVRIGRELIEKTIREAFAELRDKNIPSRAFPGKKLHEIVRPLVIHALIINEHMDHDEFEEAESAGTVGELIERFWVEFALNGKDAKRWAISSAGACCLSQFTCPTYEEITSQYPEAKLDPVYFRGMQNHVNAIQSSVVLFDRDMGMIWSEKAKKECTRSRSRLEECWPASYNGGPYSLNQAISQYGSKWDKLRLTHRNGEHIYKPRIYKETYIFLQKFRAIRAYLKQN